MAKKARILAFIGTLLLFGGGRWFNLYIIDKTPVFFAVQWAILYGLLTAFIVSYLIDLVLARGLLQIKINIIKILVAFYVLALLFNHLLLKGYLQKSPLPFIIEASLLLLLVIVLLKTDSYYKRKSNFVFDDSITLPKTYLKPHILKTFLESLFRLLPYPVPVGLYRAGNPGDKSPVIVTGNYELTVRRVVRELKKRDCWLLVCDSRGINIWCSSLANHFNTGKIIQAIKLVNLGERTANRKIILPQLCAANISLKEIKEQTGFYGSFGPVRIKDINTYFEDYGNRDIRKITFHAGERLEMACGTLIFPVLALLLLFNFIDPEKLFIILPVVYGLSFLSAFIFPYRFIRNVRLWSLFAGITVFGFVYGLFGVILHLPVLLYAVTIGVAVVYLINEFEGWSPLVKFSMTSAYKKAEITINEQLCTGCGKCVEVCPRGVYDVINKKSRVVDLAACISCKSCFVQCPVAAIEHSARFINETLG